MSSKSTELCILLVEETLGELPARIFKALMTYGRQQIFVITKHTGLTLSQVRHGLGILIQQHLVVWSSGSSTFYEAYWPDAYALVRSGKFSRVARDRLDAKAEQILSKCIVDGNSRATGLESLKDDITVNGDHQKPHENGINGRSQKPSQAPELFTTTIFDLLEEGVIVLSNISHFKSKTENLARAEEHVRAAHPAWKEKIKPSERSEFHGKVQRTLKSWKYGSKSVRHAIQQRDLRESIVLTGEFQTIEDVQEENSQRPTKRLKTSHQGISSSSFNSELTVRANNDKYTVLARSQRLTQMAADRIGITTSRVYATVLHLLDKDEMYADEFQRGAETPMLDDDLKQSKLETSRILKAMGDVDDLRAALGTPYNSIRGSSKINRLQVDSQKNSHNNHNLSDSDDHPVNRDDTDSDSDVAPRKRVRKASNPKERESDAPLANGKVKGKGKERGKETTKVDIEYEPDINDGTDHEEGDDSAVVNHQALRQHLLILADHGLLKHHSPINGMNGKERWSVPFALLSHELRLHEINTSIAAHFGTPALRIARILQEKGKLDEKTLIAQALIDTKVIRSTLTAMHSAGYMELQELPRDNNRAPSKTLYLWFFDEQRCAKKLLEDHYTAMSRCLQRLRAEREHVKDLLEKSARIDVKGKEQEFLVDEEWERMERWREIEERLLGEIDRLDDAVLVLRDL